MDDDKIVNRGTEDEQHFFASTDRRRENHLWADSDGWNDLLRNFSLSLINFNFIPIALRYFIEGLLESSLDVDLFLNI